MNETRLHCRQALLPDGWARDVLLEVDGTGRIRSVRSGAEPDGAERLKGFVIPGMPNVHSHGFQCLLTGRTGPQGRGQDHFWSWRVQMYRLANLLDPRQYEDCLAWIYLQMLRAGYTSCAEFHYLHHQPDGRPYADPAEMSKRALSAARRAGMPLTLLPVLYCRSGFAAKEVEPAQRRFFHEPEAYLELVEACRAASASHPLLAVGIAPHSLRAVPGAFFTGLRQHTLEATPVHIHVAEQPAEVEDCLAHTGARPVQWLLNEAPVDERWCLVHATHMTREERSAAAATGAVAGLCPTTEADLGDGLFDLEQWMGHGGYFGIGSDSNVQWGVTGELRLLEYEARLRAGRRNVLVNNSASVGENLFTRAASAGARAIGQPAGCLVKDRRADLVELDAEHPLLAGLNASEVLDAWVFSGGQQVIRSVRIAGRQVVEQGMHAREEAIERAFRDTALAIRRA